MRSQTAADCLYVFRIVMCLLALFAICASAAGGSEYKRLIFKDGSFELITQYERRGDRVRFFSFERNEWEEIPAELIDWPATERFAGDAAARTSEKTSRTLEQAEAERKEEEARIPEVAPGLRLPSPDSVFLLDTNLGELELNRLRQNGADLKKNTGRNILRGIVNPIGSSRQTVELKGLRAAVQSHVLSPVIYFPIDPEDTEAGYDSKTAHRHLRIVRCRESKGNRVVAAIKIAIYGKATQNAAHMDVNVVPVSNYWVKITPVLPLEPGEYALVEYSRNGAMNQFVWDFGVDPLASANPETVRPVPERKEPELIQRPRKKNSQSR